MLLHKKKSKNMLRAYFLAWCTFGDPSFWQIGPKDSIKNNVSCQKNANMFLMSKLESNIAIHFINQLMLLYFSFFLLNFYILQTRSCSKMHLSSVLFFIFYFMVSTIQTCSSYSMHPHFFLYIYLSSKFIKLSIF